MPDFPDVKPLMNVRSTRIAGLGHYVPERRIENSVIERELGLADGWIARRTGIRARRWAAPDQAVTDMAVEAASFAMARAGIVPGVFGFVLLVVSSSVLLL